MHLFCVQPGYPKSKMPASDIGEKEFYAFPTCCKLGILQTRRCANNSAHFTDSAQVE